MRRIVASFFVSIDGVVEAPETWQSPYFDDEMGGIVGQAMATSDGFLLGRRTYEQWAAFWPTAESPIAPMMNQMPKYVVSTSLRQAAWQNSTVLGGDVIREVGELKERPGRDLSVSGSATLVRTLLQKGLLDELRLLIHPVLVGRGGRLFETDAGHVSLQLADSQRLASGVINATYRPAR